MAQQNILEVNPRTILGKATRRLRRQGIIPGNVYGHKRDSVPVQVEAVSLERFRREHGLRSVISVRLPHTGPQTVLVRQIQHDPITGAVLHVDFSRVDMEEDIEAKIPIRFVGEAPGVKVQGGVFIALFDTLSVHCKAADIVDHMDVDISSLTSFDDILYARDVKLPEGYRLSIDPEEPIAKIEPPRTELPGLEAAEAAAAEAETARVESESES